MVDRFEKNQSALADALRNSVADVFKTMAGLETTFVGIKQKEKFSLSGRPAGAMMVNIKNRSGVLAVVFTDALARRIASGLTGAKAGDITREELSDVLAEVVNMVGGGMKTSYGKAGIDITPPLSVTGDGFTLDLKTDHPTLALAFRIMGGTFEVLAYM